MSVVFAVILVYILGSIKSTILLTTKGSSYLSINVSLTSGSSSINS